MSITSLVIVLVALILVSGFFAASETALMSINKYQLRHQARSGSAIATLLLQLLERPDRLLGVILIGNTAANIIASSVATVICVQLWGELGVLIGTIGLTFIVLIFAEISPKTFAALHPMGLARWIAWPIYVLRIVLYPLVWIGNIVANGFLRLLGVKVTKRALDALNAEELRTLVHDSGHTISEEHQNMLLGVLDLTGITVEDIMVPRQEVVGIDLDDDWQDILKQLHHSNHTRLPVYRGSLDNIEGVLHLRSALHLLAQNRLDRENLQRALFETYFVPAGTPLNVQLLNFRKVKNRSAIVVDEYGDVEGMVTLEDILEEIVGKFTTNIAEMSPDIHVQPDGSFIIDGSILIRELNRELNWRLPTEHAKTLSGLIIEILETIPKTPLCLYIGVYRIEVMKIQDNIIRSVKILAPAN